MRFQPKKPLIVFAIVLGIILAANHFDFASTRTATKLGYRGHDGWWSWSATYSLLDGPMQRSIHTKTEPDKLLIETKTISGTISMEIRTKDGSIVYEKENMGTTSFRIDVPGKVEVRITAKNHKGSFNILCE